MRLGKPTSRLHLSLHGMPASDWQRFFNGAGCGRHRLPLRRDPAALAPTQSRQRAHGHSVGLPGLRHVDLERPKARADYTRRASRPRRHAGRHFLAASDRAFVDPQRAALGRLARRGSEVRDAAGGPRLDASRLGVRRSRSVAGWNIGQSNAHHVIRRSDRPSRSAGKAIRG
jgi:hypothetical protein